MKFTELLLMAAQSPASDLHLVPGEQPILRIDGRLERQTALPVLSAEDMERLLSALPLSQSSQILPEAPGVDFIVTPIRSPRGLTAVVRIWRATIPTLHDICGEDAQDAFASVAARSRGLVVFTGPTASGKMTTAAAVLETINQSRAERIFLFEEMPNYRWENKMSIGTTLRIGEDYDSYEQAARLIQHGGDSDVILFNDLPNEAAVRQALILADTGHLVFAVFAAESAAEAVAQLARALPEPHATARVLLARTLAAVFNQRLIPRVSGRGRVPAYEILMTSPTVQQIIRDSAEAPALHAAMASAEERKSRTMAQAIDLLLARGDIREEVAHQFRVG